MVLAVIAVIGAASTVKRPARARPPAVQVTPGGFALAAGGRGTDAWADLDNPTPDPLDVVVRVRGWGMDGRLVVQDLSGPHRGVPPGGRLPIQVQLSATPLAAVTFEVVEERPAGRLVMNAGP